MIGTGHRDRSILAIGAQTNEAIRSRAICAIDRIAHVDPGGRRARRSGSPLRAQAGEGRAPAGDGIYRTMTSPSGSSDQGDGPPTGPSLTIKQVRQRLNVSDNTVLNAIKAGKLAAFKFLGTYRVRKEDLAAYVESCRVPARGPEAKPPAPGPTTLKHLDGSRLRAAWTARGVRAARPGGGSARSSGSTRDPSAGTGS